MFAICSAAMEKCKTGWNEYAASWTSVDVRVKKKKKELERKVEKKCQRCMESSASSGRESNRSTLKHIAIRIEFSVIGETYLSSNGYIYSSDKFIHI